MKLLQDLFKRKKSLPNSPKLKICIIDDTTTDLWTTFGITEKRRDQIIDICKDGLMKFDVKSKSYEFIVDKCNHVNEVVTATIIFERMCDEQNEHPLAGLMKLFGQ